MQRPKNIYVAFNTHCIYMGSFEIGQPESYYISGFTADPWDDWPYVDSKRLKIRSVKQGIKIPPLKLMCVLSTFQTHFVLHFCLFAGRPEF